MISNGDNPLEPKITLTHEFHNAYTTERDASTKYFIILIAMAMSIELTAFALGIYPHLSLVEAAVGMAIGIPYTIAVVYAGMCMGMRRIGQHISNQIKLEKE